MTRLLIVFALATLVLPVVGFVVFGDAFETRIADWVRRFDSPAALSFAVAGALSIDLALPIPSSVVLTYAGQKLGIVMTTIAGVAGLTVSAEVGYWLGRLGGRPLAARLSSAEDLDRLDSASTRTALWWLILSRPLPLLAEAATLGAGLTRVPHRLFFIAVTLANTWVCGVFATLGSFAGERYQLPVLVASAVLPLAATWWLRRWPR